MKGGVMFREMRRKGQQLSDGEAEEILINEKRGVLSVIGDGGYPYGVPINHLYVPGEGKLYFHGSGTGHKIDAIKSCDKASFTVYDSGYKNEGEWALNIRSVIAFGRIRELEDQEKKLDICKRLCHKFTDDKEYIDDEIRRFGKAVHCLEFTIEHMTGKMVKES